MSTVVYQGLPSFLDPAQLNESRALRLKLASPRSHCLSHSLEMAICTVLDSDSKILFRENGGGDAVKQHKFSNRPSTPGLSFLQTLSTTISQKTNENQSSLYFHPSVKRASSILSDKSLELCTENLGSETGTDIIEDENNIFSSATNCANAENRKNLPRKVVDAAAASSRRSRAPKTFPPPLSTMMGSDTVHVRPIRENGRLILQAVKVQHRTSCFQADRSNGRVRLRLLEAGNSSSSSDQGAAENEYIDYSTRDDTTANDDVINNCSSNDNSSEGQQEPQDVVGNSGSDNVEWQGRSKEGGNGNTEGLLLDSESLWVATS